MDKTKVKVNYILYSGEAVEVEVTHEQAQALDTLFRYESSHNRCETRRHHSLDHSIELGFQLIDERINIERDYIEREEQKNLHGALNKLNQSHRTLINDVFFYGKHQNKLAQNMGVTKAAVQNKLVRIYKQLRKDL